MRIDAFREIWVVDFEFGYSGERPDPGCLVAYEVNSGREIRLWEDELKTGPCPYQPAPIPSS